MSVVVVVVALGLALHPGAESGYPAPGPLGPGAATAATAPRVLVVQPDGSDVELGLAVRDAVQAVVREALPASAVSGAAACPLARCAIAAAKGAGAPHVVASHVAAAGDAVVVTLGLFEVKSGARLARERVVVADVSQLGVALPPAVRRLLSPLTAPPPPSPPPLPSPISTPRATTFSTADGFAGAWEVVVEAKGASGGDVVLTAVDGVMVADRGGGPLGDDRRARGPGLLEPARGARPALVVAAWGKPDSPFGVTSYVVDGGHLRGRFVTWFESRPGSEELVRTAPDGAAPDAGSVVGSVVSSVFDDVVVGTWRLIRSSSDQQGTMTVTARGGAYDVVSRAGGFTYVGVGVVVAGGDGAVLAVAWSADRTPVGVVVWRFDGVDLVGVGSVGRGLFHERLRRDEVVR